MNKKVWYGVATLFILLAVTVTATILDGKHSVVTHEQIDGPTPLATSTPDNDRDDQSPTPPQKTIQILPKEPPVVSLPKTPKCYVGGCSGQICSSERDMVTTCQWQEEYACYQTATCEVQSSGTCGWTPTPELNACLATPPGTI